MIRSIAADGRPDLGGVFRPIDRPRVLERLAMSARYRIATIIAPAGFGKSVAVRQFLATVSSSVVYDVPSDAASLVPFVRGFADALEARIPALRRSLATALDGARDSETPGRDLAAWAATHIRTLDTLIVIDDLHVGENDPEVSRFVTTLVDRTKDGPRWLFSSRSPLQLPVASWLAYGESDLVIDAVDLRFSLDEARQSARATRVAVRDDELSAILELIEGWPAALTFALRTSMRASDLRAVSAGTREMVYRYLAEQVWNSLDERIREFLRTAAFLPRLETRLAVAAGFDDAASIIEALRERVAFITILDNGVYRLHELFRDFIQRQIELEGDDALRAARIAAGRILEAVGMPGLALVRYIDAAAHADIVRLLGEHNFSLLENGHFDVVERALRTVPAAAANGAPRLLALRAAIEDAHGRVDQAERWYLAVLERADEASPFRISVAWRYALLLFQQGRFDAVPILTELAARDDLETGDRAHVLGSLAMTNALAGRRSEAEEALAEAMELAQFCDDALRARTYVRAATVAFYAGAPAAVEHYSREGTRLAVECGDFSLAARLQAGLYAQHAFAGQTVVAAWHAAQVATNAEKAGDPQMRAMGLRALLQLEAERGNAERIAEIETDLRTLSYRGHVALYAEIMGRALSLIWQERYGECQALLTAVSERDMAWYQHRSRYALLAAVAAVQNSRNDARDALASYEAAVERDDDDGAIFDRVRGAADRFAALANLLLGRNVIAQRMMRSYESAADQLGPFDALLSALANRSPEAVEDALRAMRLTGQIGVARALERLSLPLRAEPAAGPDAALTAAELGVLRAMALGLSNQAIADDQRRTVNTVRTHVSAILRKLEAATRGEAVAAARRRQLI